MRAAFIAMMGVCLALTPTCGGCGSAAPTKRTQSQSPFTDGQIVTLTGQLHCEPFFGPPNYGENPEEDSVESAYILVLDEPFDYVVDSDPAILRVLEVHVGPMGRFPKLTDHVFHGELADAMTGHHRRPVMLFLVP